MTEIDSRPASTILAGAYITPVINEQSCQMRWHCAEAGVTEHVFVIESNCGGMMLQATDNLVEMTFCGPTGGSAAGKYTARLLDSASPVALDMRPTWTDCPTIVNGQENFTTNVEIE